MIKQEVQQRVSRFGKKLKLSEFTWDEKTRTFSSDLDNLVLDFNGESDCQFTTGSNCTFKTGYNCTFKTGYSCTFTTLDYCTFKTLGYCTFTTLGNCTFTTLGNCTFKTGGYCTFKTDSDCTFTTDWNCTFTTGNNCTFKTLGNCTFKTGSNCTFTTSYSCTFTTGGDCSFTTGSNCVVVRRDIYEVTELKGETKLLPYRIKGHIVKLKGEEYFHYPNDTKRIEIIDGIVSEVISDKGNVLKVKNLNEDFESYIVKSGDKYAHGKTIKEAKESLIYKITNRDTSKYKDLTLESKLTFEQGVELYRTITGSCESQTKVFAEKHKFKGTKTIKEIIEITKGQFNNETLSNFFKH